MSANLVHTVTDDLAIRLLAAIAGAEDSARRQDEHLSGHDRPYNIEDPTDPTVVVRRCAADRETIEAWRQAVQWLPQRERVRSRDDVWNSGYASGLAVALSQLADAYGLTAEPAP